VESRWHTRIHVRVGAGCSHFEYCQESHAGYGAALLLELGFGAMNGMHTNRAAVVGLLVKLFVLVMALACIVWAPFRPGLGEGEGLHWHAIVLADGFSMRHLLEWETYLVQVSSVILGACFIVAIARAWPVPIRLALALSFVTFAVAPAFNGNYTYSLVACPLTYADYDWARMFLQLLLVWAFCAVRCYSRDVGGAWAIALCVGVLGWALASVVDEVFVALAGAGGFPSESIASDGNLISSDSLPYVWSYLHRRHASLVCAVTYAVLFYIGIVRFRPVR